MSEDDDRPGDDEQTQPLSGWRPGRAEEPAADAPRGDVADDVDTTPVSPVPDRQSYWSQPPPAEVRPMTGPAGPPPPSAPQPWPAAPVTRPLEEHLEHGVPDPDREGSVRARPSRWVWPAVVVLALLLGLVGGGLGAYLYDRATSVDGPGILDGGLGAAETRASAPLDADNGSVAAVARALLPSTVQIIAAFDGEDEGATGSGFVLDRDGHIVTNNHVVQSAAEDQGPIVVVDAEGRRRDAVVVGRSPVYDLAILKIENSGSLEPAALGASRVLSVGDPVVAFGSPLGLSQTVTSGIVSALGRPVTTGDSDNESSYINAVQTDAAINPGNSGGPLVNLTGEVVGVNSAIATTGGSFGSEQSGNIGVGFAIPIEQVRVTADQILRTGKAQYPVIGAQVNTGGPGPKTGASIVEVMPDTPAQRAGLEKDDVITEVEGEIVTDGIALIVAIRTHQPGETIEFTVVRDGEEQQLKITLDGEVG